MTQMDARITELMARLAALERERAEILAEIDTLRSLRSEEAAAIKAVPSAKVGDPIDRNSTIEKKIALFRRLFRGRSGFRWKTLLACESLRADGRASDIAARSMTSRILGCCAGQLPIN